MSVGLTYMVIYRIFWGQIHFLEVYTHQTKTISRDYESDVIVFPDTIHHCKLLKMEIETGSCRRYLLSFCWGDIEWYKILYIFITQRCTLLKMRREVPCWTFYLTVIKIQRLAVNGRSCFCSVAKWNYWLCWTSWLFTNNYTLSRTVNQWYHHSNTRDSSESSIWF